jgi:flagellar L-ring protein precursor FlgH
MTRTGLCMLLAGTVLLGGCDIAEKRLYSTPPEIPPTDAPPQPTNGAIGAPGAGLVLFEDAKAHSVGDLLTVHLVESTTAQKSATADSSKSDNDTLGNIAAFSHTIKTAGSISSSRAFAGKGDAAQSNSLQGSITVAVAQRLPNGNLLVRGKKEIQINTGYEYVMLEGVIRPADIATDNSADNSVSSDRVGNARISYTGHGQVADSNVQGWLSRFFSASWFPF